MSFYIDQIKALMGSKNWGNQQVTVTLIITNMKDDEDARKLASVLQSIPGITNVVPFPRHRRLTITYNSSQITLEAIGYHIARLGYHYLHKI
ncbi:MAG: heavy-metal-associated domain-containing protein [Thermanaeromonas sp.]|uniref:heavy-metal-associated domain-containing protein n=1 Tax=Thermanaeromonas sp. TaxID=2003697 RepID=UPI002440C432|nr:heavy-metal-associated domain-containing protein [Thermanaeromonas sp.]MCG0278901.1 heavy-metal-associated domain-containing protein [Thermanaeromonas sp.]